MALTYNAVSKTWVNTPEQTNNDKSRPTGDTVYPIYKDIIGKTFYEKQLQGYATKAEVDAGKWRFFNNYTAVGKLYNKPDSPYITIADGFQADANSSPDLLANIPGAGDWKYNDLLNKEAETLNKQNEAKNNIYNTIVATATTTRGGDYVANREAIAKLKPSLIQAGISEVDADKLISNATDQYKTFYQTEKLQTWDPALGAKPAYGDFNAQYYKEINPTVAEQWKNAVANDDIDITERYGENGFYLQHYTTQGKPLGRRGNAAEITEQTNKYIETKPTDKDLQNVRDLQLGVNTATQTQRLLNIPQIAAEFKKAQEGDPYWTNQAKEKFLDPSKEDEFIALFRLSERPEDKQISLNYNVNAGYGVTELEDALNQAVGEKSLVDTKRFGALTQNVLKDTINEMKKAKAKESALGLLSGLGGFSEITNINKTIANSMLGDTGIGGLLSMTSEGDPEKDLEKSLQNITGVRNNATYNWQQWFDTALKTKYDKDLELGYTTTEAEEQIKIDTEFARKFIDDYLAPRFNQSKSMDEFVEYLDVRQEEKNPFQTEDMLSAVSRVADQKAQTYLDQLKTTKDSYFDFNFYFNPTGDKAREGSYAEQASTVAADWQTAKTNADSLIDPKRPTLGTWAQQAYRFGTDISDKEAFARLHFQLIGSMPKDVNNPSLGMKYDGAEDILNASKVQDEIFTKILPALKTEALRQRSVFGQFITPEEFADEALRGLDPADKDTWNEALKRFGLDNFKGTIDELKETIKETLRTGSAQTIRENIKYLNEKRQRPTQENLGLTYIERAEDFTNKATKPTTELFSVFQSAGYQGTEDEFYTKFFPDVDRSEQTLLTKAGTGSGLGSFNLDTSDPFAALGSIDDLFSEETASTNNKTSTDSSSSSGFFNLGLEEEDEDTDYKTNTGQKILGEFTSMFKGL